MPFGEPDSRARHLQTLRRQLMVGLRCLSASPTAGPQKSLTLNTGLSIMSQMPFGEPDSRALHVGANMTKYSPLSQMPFGEPDSRANAVGHQTILITSRLRCLSASPTAGPTKSKTGLWRTCRVSDAFRRARQPGHNRPRGPQTSFARSLRCLSASPTAGPRVNYGITRIDQPVSDAFRRARQPGPLF